MDGHGGDSRHCSVSKAFGLKQCEMRSGFVPVRVSSWWMELLCLEQEDFVWKHCLFVSQLFS